jgi:hypothetical protein
MAIETLHIQGRIQDFKLGGGALKKIAPSGGRREKCWGISCEKSRFYDKKIIFFPNLRGARRVRSIMENFHLKFHFALSDYCVILSLFIVLYKIKQHNHVCPVTTLTHVTYIFPSHICLIYIRGGSRGVID